MNLARGRPQPRSGAAAHDQGIIRRFIGRLKSCSSHDTRRQNRASPSSIEVCGLKPVSRIRSATSAKVSGHVSGLHRQHLLDRRAAQFLLQNRYHMHEVFRTIVADIVNPAPARRPRRASRGGLVDQSQYDARHVVDIGKVAPHPAMVKEPDRGALNDRLGEQEDRHIGPSPRPVDGKEPQARYRKAVEMAVGMRDQLVGLLRGGVEADRMVGLVVHRKRQLGIGAVDRRGRRIDQMAASVMPATFQHIDETLEIGVDIGMRMVDRIAHASLRREMNHRWQSGVWRTGVPLTPRSARSICSNAKPGSSPQDVQARPLQRRIVITVEVVEADHSAAFGQQPAGDVEADETRSPGDQYWPDPTSYPRRHRSTACNPFRASLPRMPGPPQYPAAPLLPDRPENHTKAPNSARGAIAPFAPSSNLAVGRDAPYPAFDDEDTGLGGAAVFRAAQGQSCPSSPRASTLRAWAGSAWRLP